MTMCTFVRHPREVTVKLPRSYQETAEKLHGNCLAISGVHTSYVTILGMCELTKRLDSVSAPNFIHSRPLPPGVYSH